MKRNHKLLLIVALAALAFVGISPRSAMASNSYLATLAGTTAVNGTYTQTTTVINGAYVWTNGTDYLYEFYYQANNAYYWIFAANTTTTSSFSPATSYGLYVTSQGSRTAPTAATTPTLTATAPYSVGTGISPAPTLALIASATRRRTISII